MRRRSSSIVVELNIIARDAPEGFDIDQPLTETVSRCSSGYLDRAAAIRCDAHAEPPAANARRPKTND
jgi:hypothetical protein